MWNTRWNQYEIMSQGRTELQHLMRWNGLICYQACISCTVAFVCSLLDPVFLYIKPQHCKPKSQVHTFKKIHIHQICGETIHFGEPYLGKTTLQYPYNSRSIISPETWCAMIIFKSFSLSLSQEAYIVLLVIKVCQPPVVQPTLLHPLPWLVFWTVGWTLLLCFEKGTNLGELWWFTNVMSTKAQNLLGVSSKVKSITYIKWLELSFGEVLKRKCFLWSFGFTKITTSSLKGKSKADLDSLLSGVDSIWIPVDVNTPPNMFQVVQAIFVHVPNKLLLLESAYDINNVTCLNRFNQAFKQLWVAAWNPKQPFINGCFNWMIPNLYIGNGWKSPNIHL